MSEPDIRGVFEVTHQVPAPIEHVVVHKGHSLTMMYAKAVSMGGSLSSVRSSRRLTLTPWSGA